MSDTYLMLMTFGPLVGFAIWGAWLKYTEYQIDKQYEERQDDE